MKRKQIMENRYGQNVIRNDQQDAVMDQDQYAVGMQHKPAAVGRSKVAVDGVGRGAVAQHKAPMVVEKANV